MRPSPARTAREAAGLSLKEAANATLVTALAHIQRQPRLPPEHYVIDCRPYQVHYTHPKGLLLLDLARVTNPRKETIMSTPRVRPFCQDETGDR